MSRIRSSSGCWTCRLRRKKCDETKPECHRCSKLQLECENYPERPSWMDGGELEKIKLEQTKRLVRENMGSSSKRHAGRRQSLGQRTFSESSISNLATAIINQLSESSSPLDEEVNLENRRYCPDLPSQNNNELESYAPLGEGAHGLSLPDPSTYNDDQVQGSKLSSRQSSLSQVIQFISPYNFSNPEDNNYEPSFGSQYLNISSSDSSSAFSSSTSPSRSSHRPSTPEEASLLLQYLEVVCDKQFLMVAKADRGWLYMAITSTDIGYWATLSLASYYQGSDSLSYFYNNLAILELRKNILLIEFKQTKSLSMILQCCFCMIQLIFLEKLRGNLEAFKMHMHAACSLLANFKNTSKANSSSELSATTSDTDTANLAMLQLVVITLRWFDVLSSCSLHSLPSISVPLLDMLQTESDTTQMDARIIYQSQVAANLTEALELQHWKTTAAKAGRLSVVELVKRAAAIESKMLPDRDIIQTSRGQMLDSITGERLISHVAKIFTSTIKVYLQVIVAGSHREVPEISKGVSHTVSLFRDFSGTQALDHLAWPFCFIGCLATGCDREFVANLADEAVSQSDCTLNIKWASTIIKECWRLLDEEMVIDPDWESAMKSLECQFVLF